MLPFLSEIHTFLPPLLQANSCLYFQPQHAHPSLQKLSMNPYSMPGPLVTASQISLYFPFGDVDDNNYDHNNH